MSPTRIVAALVMLLGTVAPCAGEELTPTSAKPETGLESSGPSDAGSEKTPGVPRSIGRALLNRVCGSVVTIDVPLLGNGSGFFYRDENALWVVSNCHVIGLACDASQLEIHDMNGNRVPVTSEVKADLEGDIALVRVDDSYRPASWLSDGGSPAVGETILAVGNAKGDGIVYPLDGEVVGLGSLHGVPILEVSARFVPGCSGGPVVNTKGELLGVIAFIVSLPKEKEGDSIFKDTPFSETRRMAVRTARIHKAQPGRLTDLYVYNRASRDRIALFVLYMLSQTADTPQKKDWVSRMIADCLRESDQPILKMSLVGVRRSGLLDPYYKALLELQAMHQKLRPGAEKNFLLWMRKRLTGTVIDHNRQDYIDQTIRKRLDELR